MKRSKVAPMSPADRDDLTVARISDRFYRWDTTYVWHPLEHRWVIPVFRERDFINWTWYHADGRELTVELDHYDLIIVNAYLTAQRNLHMFSVWKELSKLPIPAALEQLRAQPLTTHIRFLYEDATAARHEALLREWPVFHAEFNACRERAFRVPTPPPSPPTSPPKKRHILPAGFRRAIELLRQQNEQAHN